MDTHGRARWEYTEIVLSFLNVRVSVSMLLLKLWISSFILCPYKESSSMRRHWLYCQVQHVHTPSLPQSHSLWPWNCGLAALQRPPRAVCSLEQAQQPVRRWELWVKSTSSHNAMSCYLTRKQIKLVNILGIHLCELGGTRKVTQWTRPWNRSVYLTWLGGWWSNQLLLSSSCVFLIFSLWSRLKLQTWLSHIGTSCLKF